VQTGSDVAPSAGSVYAVERPGRSGEGMARGASEDGFWTVGSEVAVPTITVRAGGDPAERHRGVLGIGSWTVPCVVGQHGLVPAAEKREGDRRTPIGVFPLRYGLYDPVKCPGFPEGLRFPFVPLQEDMIWEEDPASPHYNRLIRAAGRHRDTDRLVRRRDEGLFDLVIPIGYNDSVPAPHRGSAIFIHAARPEGSGTAGCVAVPHDRLPGLARKLVPGMVIDIGPAP
jgi:L,D-peptidoglycan transpeptidase YkuD (ErfK/YbiS/YcfS/YnhG family)